MYCANFSFSENIFNEPKSTVEDVRGVKSQPNSVNQEDVYDRRTLIFAVFGLLLVSAADAKKTKKTKQSKSIVSHFSMSNQCRYVNMENQFYWVSLRYNDAKLGMTSSILNM